MSTHCGRRRRALALLAATGALALCWVATAGASSGIITVTNDDGISIVDNANAVPFPSTVTVPGGGTVGSVTVSLIGFEHTYLGDLVITLAGPGGQTVTLVDTQGWYGNVCGDYTFADGATPFPDNGAQNPPDECIAPIAVPGWAPGTYGPFGSFAAFVGALASGEWSLSVDDQGPGDIGSIRAWALTILALLPDRAGYCAADGNKNPYDGSPIRAGMFLDLTLDQVRNDPAYAGATIANYVDGKGITCDPVPAGYVRDGFASDLLGVPANTYPFFEKA